VLIIGAFFMFDGGFGDPPPTQNVHIENHSDARLVAWMDVRVGGTEENPKVEPFRLGVVAPNETLMVSARCDLQQLSARDQSGTVVATHEPTRVCDEIVTWVIPALESHS
jgi:hypothetical protein